MTKTALKHLPTTMQEAASRGWNQLDVIFVTGDAYIDHPAFGVPLLARWLEFHGFKVGIISQPDWRVKESFMQLGRPRLCFAVSAGAMDSMVAHYTPARKLRHDDAYTPGGRHGARPNRATMVYVSRIKEAYKDITVLIGGIEASLRRFSHYDFWEDKVRRSILLDSKADLLIYGMGETALLEVIRKLEQGVPAGEIKSVPGTCRIACKSETMEQSDTITLPSFEETSSDKKKFANAFRLATREQNPWCGRTILQKHGDRTLVAYPPSLPLDSSTMDAIYNLPFTKKPHPAYKESIPAYEQIKTSITSHRGCFGGCAFCAITMHQGKTIQSRTHKSIVTEIEQMTKEAWFKGSVSDVGGPTANMYNLKCKNKDTESKCRRESCLFPKRCQNLFCNDKGAVELLKKASSLNGVKHLAISSGVRYDLMELQPDYFRELISNHVSGLLKVAPEHLVNRVTAVMRKPGRGSFENFLCRFREESARLGKRQHIVPYLISGHPGCTMEDMLELALSLKKLRLQVEQVQDFTPTPGTLSTCMYYTGMDPESGKDIYVAKSDKEKGLQKALLLWHQPAELPKIKEALRSMGKLEFFNALIGSEHKKPR